MENLGWKMLSRISNLGGGKFGVENAISNLEFGGWKIWGGKCYLESPIFGVENLGWKVLSRISNLGGGGKFGVENAISKFLIWGGGKFGVENAISNLEFGGWKIWGGKCYLESRIWGLENLGRKMLSRISFLGWKIWGGKCYLESRIWGGGGKFGVENAISKFLIWAGGKVGVENAVSNLEFGGWKI